MLVTDEGLKGDYMPTLPSVDQIPSKLAKTGEKFIVGEKFRRSKQPSLFAGDTRCMENVALSTWHTMFVRLHNLFVDAMLHEDDSLRGTHKFFRR